MTLYHKVKPRGNFESSDTGVKNISLRVNIRRNRGMG
jgi:hypothetical protein